MVSEVLDLPLVLDSQAAVREIRPVPYFGPPVSPTACRGAGGRARPRNSLAFGIPGNAGEALERRVNVKAIRRQFPGARRHRAGGHRPFPLLGPLRVGFVTYAHLRGANGRAIAHQARHRSLATLGQYVRLHEAWQDNAATQVGL